jgi:membrane protein DedA with SNARE-associated domain
MAALSHGDYGPVKDYFLPLEVGSLHPRTEPFDEPHHSRPIGSSSCWKGPATLSLISFHSLDHLLHEYGYLTIFLGIMLEAIGLPLPGESLMIAAAIFSATRHELNIFILVFVAAAGAIVGDQIGYVIGRWVGYPTLHRFGRWVGATDERLQLWHYLFHRYGGRIVFFARFVAILRTFAALLAGANKMPWRTFLIWNGLGGIAWTSLYGFGAYLLGDAAKKVSGPIGITMAAVGGAVLIAGLVFVKRNQNRLLEEAKQDMERTASQPGPAMKTA